MKSFKFIAALFLSLVLVGGGTDWVSAQENDNVWEGETYDSTFPGPLGFCVRKDTAVALAADGETMPLICDEFGNIRITGASSGTLASNSPTTAVSLLSLFDGSAETQITTTNLGASKSITITGSGRLTKMCLISSLGTPIAENGSVFFFNADPVITVDTADMTIVEAQTIEAVVSFRGADYRSNFATVVFNCQNIDEAFDSITHVVYHQEGSTTFDDEDMEMLIWYERRS